MNCSWALLCHASVPPFMRPIAACPQLQQISRQETRNGFIWCSVIARSGKSGQAASLMRILKGNKAEGKAMTPVLKIFREEIFHKLTQLRFLTKHCLLGVSKAIKWAFEKFSLNSGIYPSCNYSFLISNICLRMIIMFGQWTQLNRFKEMIMYGGSCIEYKTLRMHAIH